MGHLEPFNHYFELFAGFNAAILSFDEIREQVYNFFYEMTLRHMKFEGHKVSSPLIRVKEIYGIRINNGQATNTPDLARVNSNIQDFNKLAEKHKGQLEKIWGNVKEEYESVKNKTLPLFVFALLFCIKLVVLTAFSESYEFIAGWSFIYLGYFVTTTVLLITWSNFLYPRIRYQLRKKGINWAILKSKHFTENTSNYFIRRYVIAFCCIISSSLILTIINYFLCRDKSINQELFPVNSWLILVVTCLLCATPLIRLILCARNWKNANLRPILDHFKKICKEFREEQHLWEETIDAFETENRLILSHESFNKKITDYSKSQT